MRTRQSTSLIALSVLLALMMASPLLAATNGKVSGTITDVNTGQPIIGATVRVLETDLVTKTDDDGEYFIISLPSGKWNITATHVGFEPITKEGVRVLVDLTTPVDFEMEPAAVELGRHIVVEATEPLVQKDLTASRVIFTSDRLRTLPNIITVQSVLTNYPGVVVDRDDAMHVRGGRSGQVSYYYDGFSVQDPFVANSGMRIMPAALEELSLTSGGYTAEYGEALSGVVGAVTREGGASYHGGFKVYEGATHAYDVYQGDWSKLKLVGNRSFAFNLSGPVPGLDRKRYTLFTAGEYLTDAGHLPHYGSTSYTGTAKIALQPFPKMKLKSNVTYYEADYDIYTHRDVNGRSYDFNLDGLPTGRKEAYLVGLSGNYAFSEQVLLMTSFSAFSTMTKSAPGHLMDKYWNEWPGYSEDVDGTYNGTIHEENYGSDRDFSDPMQAVGFTVGDDFYPTYRRREAKYNSFHANLLTQVNKWNQVKAGAEYRKYDINWDSKQFFNDNPYGEKYSSRPTLASAYIQDKMEYEYFVVNVGVRYDFYNTDISYNVTPRDTVATFKKAESRSRLSPRLGMSFPISEKSVMHFNYGVYYQVPRFRYLYMNLQGDISTGYPILGNPDLEPEQTTSYELGLDHLIGEELRFDITAYYKDIDDLVTTRSSFKVAGLAVTQFTNDDYGSVKGIDVSLEKLPVSGYLSGSISYGYMIATGNASYELEPYYTYLTSTEDTLAPVTEYPLDFDQRHTVTAVLNYRVPSDWNGRLFGMKLPGAWGVTMVGHYGSGLPYTPTDADGNRLGERNEGRLPANYTVDMRFNKDFRLAGSGHPFSFFVEVDNLFNRHNVIDVYSRTGQAADDGYRIQFASAAQDAEAEKYDRLYDHDPQNFSPPRTVRVGFELNF
ncbi:MAG: TonB-dependent receptor [Candidatus Zixiibacteriota bacterium]